MPRKRSELPSAAKRKLRSLLARGGTAESITAALRADGVKVSESTIKRRIRELRPEASPRRPSSSEARRAEYASAVAAPPDAPSRDEEDDDDPSDLPTPGAVPDNAPLEQIDRWLARAEKIGRIAYAKGDLP